jgi:hypothetical protein
VADVADEELRRASRDLAGAGRARVRLDALDRQLRAARAMALFAPVPRGWIQGLWDVWTQARSRELATRTTSPAGAQVSGPTSRAETRAPRQRSTPSSADPPIGRATPPVRT